MNFTHTSIINSIFTNGHYLTIFELDYYTTSNHPRYIFQDAVYDHVAVLGANGLLSYSPVYTPLYTSRAYKKYEDALPEYQAFYDVYQKTPDPTTNIKSKAGFGTEVSKMYFDEIAKEVIGVNDTNNIKFNEPTNDMPAYVEFDFYICGHKYTACVYINANIDDVNGNITSNIIDGNNDSKHIIGHGIFYIGYDKDCGYSIGDDKSIYIEDYPDMNDGNTLDFTNEHGIPTDTVFRFIHRKALDVFTKYFFSKKNS